MPARLPLQVRQRSQAGRPARSAVGRRPTDAALAGLLRPGTKPRATGYIGSAVVRRLEEDGHDVVALVKGGTEVPPGTPTRVGDLTDPDSLRAAVTDEIDAVLNIATPTGDSPPHRGAGAGRRGRRRILFIRPDVAAVNVHQRPMDLKGNVLTDLPEGRPFYVLAKDDGDWKIAAAQNTQVMKA
ncbi:MULTISPECIES: SDR family oxidoreductase [Nonomuraea]|uniref:SDR family oxidoreductase n=1 Tax=Nonomuraea mangrovi TaxID=2316207 RepID=A0ABW4T984_9ACTN